ncbi:hypothetical protein [Sphingomicrobium clamense]|uniref:Uncharacterized protein n=1 Tax=Sphingomicrobium clamense TaxID=2851013 RepID=A0ABS6V874_9SPHN|nr:hypothetical protein [Sphingomicrobium sp. B8]MBW0145756.1 hypothetical protein [Sphingomicrobium sp. B8]
MNALSPEEKIPDIFAQALAMNPRAAATYRALDLETRRALCDTIARAPGCGARNILVNGAIRELLAD